jgi:hypothetical protein
MASLARQPKQNYGRPSPGWPANRKAPASTSGLVLRSLSVVLEVRVSKLRRRARCACVLSIQRTSRADPPAQESRYVGRPALDDKPCRKHGSWIRGSRYCGICNGDPYEPTAESTLASRSQVPGDVPFGNNTSGVGSHSRALDPLSRGSKNTPGAIVLRVLPRSYRHPVAEQLGYLAAGRRLYLS